MTFQRNCHKRTGIACEDVVNMQWQGSIYAAFTAEDRGFLEWCKAWWCQASPPKSSSKFEVSGQSRFKQSLGYTSCCHKASRRLPPEQLQCCDLIYSVVRVPWVLWAGNTGTCKNKPKLYQVMKAAVKAGLPTAWPTAAIFTVPCRWSSMLVKLKVAWDQPWNSQS